MTPQQAEPEARPADAGAFEAHAVESIGAVRDAMARIIERKCPGSKAVSSVCEAFGIHRKLAWQLVKVVYSEDPFVAARHMPSPKSISVWLEAARGSGVPDEMVDDAARAAQGFESLAEAHAASRTEFEMLLESCVGPAEADAKWRERAFEGNSYIWGVRCRVLLSMSVLLASDDREGWFHMAQVRGLVGYRQTRPGVRWIVNQSVVLEGDAPPPVERVALDPEEALANGGVPVLGAYCSQPMPQLRRVRASGGILQDEMLPGPVGKKGQRTLVTGELVRNISKATGKAGRVANFGIGVRIPAETLHFDLFVQKGLFPSAERELRVFSDLASQTSADDADALPVGERIVALGAGLAMAHTPDVGSYAQLASGVFSMLGVDPGGFELHRVRIPHPPMPSSVMMRHRLSGGDAE